MYSLYSGMLNALYVEDCNGLGSAKHEYVSMAVVARPTTMTS